MQQHSADTTAPSNWIIYADEKVEESFYRSGVKGLVAWVLSSTYAFEELNRPIVSDGCWERMVDIVYDNREEALKHPFGKILERSCFFTSPTLVHFHVDPLQYPNSTKEHAKAVVRRLESN